MCSRSCLTGGERWETRYLTLGYRAYILNSNSESPKANLVQQVTGDSATGRRTRWCVLYPEQVVSYWRYTVDQVGNSVGESVWKDCITGGTRETRPGKTKGSSGRSYRCLCRRVWHRDRPIKANLWRLELSYSSELSHTYKHRHNPLQSHFGPIKLCSTNRLPVLCV